MPTNKYLSSPFATGGGGHRFEILVQTSMAVLMLSRGRAPCFEHWPITKITLQGRKDGYAIDDVILYVGNEKNDKNSGKLLGQIKSSINITEKNKTFGEVIQAAWRDFNNSELFSKKQDKIALITGLLSETDINTVVFLLNQAKSTLSVGKFLENINRAGFSPSQCQNKLEVFRYHLNQANDNQALSDQQLYDFLKDFYLLSYDFPCDNSSTVQSLLYSHLSQFPRKPPCDLFSRIFEFIAQANKNAGTLTIESFPEDIQEAFKTQPKGIKPPDFVGQWAETDPIEAINQDPSANKLVTAVLIGDWNEDNHHDQQIIAQISGIEFEQWKETFEYFLYSHEPKWVVRNLSFVSIKQRIKLWQQLGRRIYDKNIDAFSDAVIQVLKAQPGQYSYALRQGLAEGLAILANYPDSCEHCSPNKVINSCHRITDELFTDADWQLWSDLSVLLPNIAEATPKAFLDAVDNALGKTPSPLEIFTRNNQHALRDQDWYESNYGLVYALEALAWDEQYIVKASVLLAKLASMNADHFDKNRPFESLVFLLLPWYPQTLAPFEKHQAVINTLDREYPKVAWELTLQLLPGAQKLALPVRRSQWRNPLPDDWEAVTTTEEYDERILSYAEYAVTAAGHDFNSIYRLINEITKLPKKILGLFLDKFTPELIKSWSNEQQFKLWERFVGLIHRHRKFSNQSWALPSEALNQLESLAETIKPKRAFDLHRPLFDNDYPAFYEQADNFEEQHQRVDQQREQAINEIYQQQGIKGIFDFATIVKHPEAVGQSLVGIEDTSIEQPLLPDLLDRKDKTYEQLVKGFIWARFHRQYARKQDTQKQGAQQQGTQKQGWQWVDQFDMSKWTDQQMAQFLAYLPFEQGAWQRVSQWSSQQQQEYWSKTDANAYPLAGDINISSAIMQLLHYQQPKAALSCLHSRLIKKAFLDPELFINQCLQALLESTHSSERNRPVFNNIQILELIQYLQDAELTQQQQQKLSDIEWAYLDLFRDDSEALPKTLYRQLTEDPEFFCRVIKKICQAGNDFEASEDISFHLEERRNLQLFIGWKIPPGTNAAGQFDFGQFQDWLSKVEAICQTSGYLQAAQIQIGEVLVHTPKDAEGLWIEPILEILNDEHADRFRDGFRKELVSLSFPVGATEKALAEKYKIQAQILEKKGYHRLCETLNQAVKSYEHFTKFHRD